MHVRPKYNGRYTYSDYYSWDDDQRYELVDGEMYVMSPAPTWRHQGLISKFNYQFEDFLKDRPERVFPAPFDVRLNADTSDNTVVQPDVVVICDRDKLVGTGCVGAPDMVIEILSPSTSRRDRTVKFNQYLKYGVREYWIADPEAKTVAVHLLKDGEYITRPYTDADVVPVQVLEGCTINLSKVFVD